MKINSLRQILVISLFTLLVAACSRSLPLDKSLEENFRTHETDFNKLVSMMREDVNIESIDEKGAYRPRDSNSEAPTGATSAEIPKQRLDEYRRLLRQTSVKNVLRSNDRIIFLVWEDGNGFYDRYIDPAKYQSKDYIYTETLPSPLVDSLDDSKKLEKGKDGTLGYKKITNNWFLRYSSE